MASYTIEYVLKLLNYLMNENHLRGLYNNFSSLWMLDLEPLISWTYGVIDESGSCAVVFL